MYANSPAIVSAQTQPHPRLSDIVERHRQSAYQRPLAAHSSAAWQRLNAWLARRPEAALILDSGCGTGASTVGLAMRYPEAKVVGVDQSADRLGRSGPVVDGLIAVADHAVLVRADLADLWRLMLADGVRPRRHLLWYPNPWPKPVHLMRRWHAHPVMPTLLALGGELELRSNWRVYIDEFAQALSVFGLSSVIEEVVTTLPPVTPFERKYRDSGHPLWRLSTQLPERTA